MTRPLPTRSGEIQGLCSPYAGWVRPVQALTILLWALIAMMGLNLSL